MASANVFIWNFLFLFGRIMAYLIYKLLPTIVLFEEIAVTVLNTLAFIPQQSGTLHKVKE